MTWRVTRQDWIAGFSLHRSNEDAFAFEHQHQDSPNKAVGERSIVNVDKATYKLVYDSRYGIWGK